MAQFVKSSRVLLKTHPEFSEKWLQQQIAADVELLGLGDLDVKDLERRQPGAGRLDQMMGTGTGSTLGATESPTTEQPFCPATDDRAV